MHLHPVQDRVTETHGRLPSLVLHTIGIAFALLLGAVPLTNAAPRRTWNLDDAWRFHLGAQNQATSPRFDDHTWRLVDVPHDYAIEGKFEEKNPFPVIGRDADWYTLHGFLPIQPAVYRKTVHIPADAAGKRLWLEFDGVFSNSHYWVNGRQVGSQYSGYTRSRFDITDEAICGADNVVVVQVDPRYDGWWYEGAGIYRHVRLIEVDPVHIAPDGVFASASVAMPCDGNVANATVDATTDIANSSNAPVAAVLSSEIIDDKGTVLASHSSTRELTAGGSVTIRQQIPVTQARLWSVDTPHLYHLRSRVSLSGRVVDEVTTPFGIRDIRFDSERGFFLNGKHIKIQGVTMHQDHAGVGVAVPDRLFEWKLQRLKAMGCNAIRLSHNPVSPVLLDDCDRMGFLVIAENRHLGDTFDDQSPKGTPAVENRDLSAMVMRDRNHPSIILWSLCNEQWTQGTPEAAATARSMIRRVRELDPTRPITAAMNGGFSSPNGMITTLDVIGINYQPEVYAGVHAQFPKSPIVATEIASEEGTRGVYAMNHWDNYWGDPKKGYFAAYSINAGPGGETVENAWSAVALKDYMAGGFVWSGFDYKGEPRPFGWPVVNSNYGVMDLCGFPKDSYYYYQAWWTNKPVLHLFPHWNWQGKEGQEIPVWVHTNCSEVELFLNGVSLGRKVVTPLHHLEWKVPYAPGRLVAKGLYKGTPIEAERDTTGAPAGLRLTVDRSTLAADNADVAVVQVDVVDAQGRTVPTADNRITFSLSGPGKLIGVGNGDPSCHEPDHADSRSAFNGLAQAIVQTTHTAGTVVLQADSPNLKGARLVLHSR